MSDPTPPAARLDAPNASHSAELLVHLARLVHGTSTDSTLTPAQWTALRYFASANRFSRTPSAFSEFHATTRGTASQVVKSLIGLGLLMRRAHDNDGRSALIDLTEAGRAKLADDPLGDLMHCIGALPPERRTAFEQTLSDLTEALAQRRAAPVFGTCGDCGHCDSGRASGAYCRCTQSILAGDEMQTLCVDFVPAPPRLR